MIRGTFVWHRGIDFELAPLVGRAWLDVLRVTDASATVCIWSCPDQPLPRRIQEEFCCHDFCMSAAIDRYQEYLRPGTTFSPWGTKSGPNFQFFQVLDLARRAHGETLTLWIEPDTFPLTQSIGLLAERLDHEFPDAFVIGAYVHSGILADLAPNLHQHVNGHAIYRLSAEFETFRRSIWIPSLIHVIQRYPEFAFDCLNTDSVLELLPMSLMQSWQAFAHRFVRTPHFINASTAEVRTAKDLSNILSQHMSDFPHLKTQDVFSIHVKGDPMIMLESLYQALIARSPA